MRFAFAAAAVAVAAGCGDGAPAGPSAEGGASVRAAAEVAFPGAGGEVHEASYLAADRLVPVSFQRVGGEAVAEGDILLADDLLHLDGGAGERALTAVSKETRLWPGGVVPYTLHEALARPSRVRKAMQHWEEQTPIRFVPRTDEADYVEFRPGDGCGSHVGRVGGRQALYLSEGCSTGATIHEIGHLVGLWHEQSRPDRDRFVRVVWDNVEPGHEHNFRLLEDDGARRLGAYDYWSVMHYGAYIFSANGRPTLVTADGGEPVPSHRMKLSAGDVRGVLRLYDAD